MQDDADGNELPTEDATKPHAKQQALRLACLFFNLLCGFTNGYDICVTSVLLDDLVHDLHLCGTPELETGNSFSEQQLQQTEDTGQQVVVESCAQKQAVMSISAVGSLVAKLCLPWVADYFGRRFGLALVDVLIIASVILQTSATTTGVFFCGRFVLGMAMGFAFVVEPTYICEIAPPNRRGVYVVLNEVSVCIGCLVGLQVSAGYLADASDEMHVWRLPVALGGLPAVVQFIFLCLLPESPRWLALHGSAERLDAAAMALGIAGEELAGLKATFEHRNDLVCSGGISLHAKERWQIFKASGINAKQAYAFDILAFSGIRHPRQLLPIIGWMKLAGSLLAAGLADVPQVGRRRLALYGGLACCICDVALVVRLASPESLPPNVAAIALFVSLFAWNSGYGGVQFAATLEMLPNEVRSVWSGQIFAITGIVEILIYQLFELLLFQDGVVTFAFFAGVNLCSVLFAALAMPDLHGQSLEVSGELAVAIETDPPPSPKRRASSASQRSSASSASSDAPSKVASRTKGPKARRYGKLTEEHEGRSSPTLSSEDLGDAI